MPCNMNDGSERNVHTREGVLMTRNRVLGHKKAVQGISHCVLQNPKTYK